MPVALVFACGFPCRELFRVNPDKGGLHQGETARFHEAKTLFQALVDERRDTDPPLRVLFENVQSMPEEALHEITRELRSVDPNIECVGIDAATVAHCRRPRYWWTNWYVQRLEGESETSRKGIRHLYPWLDLNPVNGILEDGCVSAFQNKGADQKYHTYCNIVMSGV